MVGGRINLADEEVAPSGLRLKCASEVRFPPTGWRGENSQETPALLDVLVQVGSPVTKQILVTNSKKSGCSGVRGLASR
jgi:hypothetical protein